MLIRQDEFLENLSIKTKACFIAHKSTEIVARISTEHYLHQSCITMLLVWYSKNSKSVSTSSGFQNVSFLRHSRRNGYEIVVGINVASIKTNPWLLLRK